jgi:hypothetical protein
LSEDSANSPFGFKLAVVSSSLSGAAVNGPTGAPPGVTIDLQANLAAGDALALTFNQPDGTTAALTLTATADSPPGTDRFTIGATPAATAANLQAALRAAVAELAATSLSAASAMAATDEFFDTDDANPPLRVNGPPFETATTLVAGTAANTMAWYAGEAGAGAARATAAARIDTSISVRYGMRANEGALRGAVKNVAVFAALTFSPADQHASARYFEATRRVQANFAAAPGSQQLADIEADIALAQAEIAGAQDRHRQTEATVADLLGSIENASMEQLGAQILALQTALQASLQTTALLARTSLINYL